jgi:hypothetical protein
MNDQLSICCETYKIGCGVKVGSDSDGGIPINMVDQSNTLGGDSTTIATGGPDNGINWRINYPNQSANVLTHESGHVGGYEDPSNTSDPAHCGDDCSIMNKNDDDSRRDVDQCLCKKLVGLAK